MFAPVGYHSAAALWEEFLERRLESVYDSACTTYASDDFSPESLRGGPLDICEHLFLKSLSLVGVHASAPDGRVVRLHVPFEDGVPSLFSAIGVYPLFWSRTANAEKKKSLRSEFPGHFQRFEAWASDEEHKLRWRKRYSSFESDTKDKRGDGPYFELKHHNMPIHYERHTFLIAKKTPPWDKGQSKSPNVAPLLENFAGWSICLDDETHSGIWQDYLHGRREVYQTKEYTASFRPTGRKPKLAARAAFAGMGSDKGDLTWEQVARKIEAQTGHKPSHKALRNWRDEKLRLKAGS